MLHRSLFQRLTTRPVLTAAGTITAGLALGGSVLKRNITAFAAEGKESNNSMLDPNEFKTFELDAVQRITHNTFKFRFVLPHDDQSTVFEMPVASCIIVKSEIDGEDVIRPYTPVTEPGTVGHFDLIIKRYDQGRMSKHIANMTVGENLLVKGPISKIPITQDLKREIGMIAGGTGITPMFQVMQHVLNMPQDKTKLSLLFANVSPQDILLKKELESLAEKHSDRLKVTFVADRIKDGEDWNGEVGYINRAMLEKYMPKPSSPDDESVIVMVCGPPGMVKMISGEKTQDKKQGELTGLLKEMGYSEKNVFKF